MQGLVSGYDVNFTSGSIGRGRMAIPKQVDRKSPAAVKKARGNSFCVKGALLFNLLPDSLRTMNTDHVDIFKNHLDVFLTSIPDQPTVAGLGRAAKTNSLLHQLPMFYNQNKYSYIFDFKVDRLAEKPQYYYVFKV